MIARVFLKPGEFHIARGPAVIETLVGSCVTVCVLNIKNGQGAMNHFLRDRPGAEEVTNVGELGTTATRHIIESLLTCDDRRSCYRAVVLGGAAVLDHSGRFQDIGAANVRAAMEVLKEHRIQVLATDVGGKKGRRVRFDTQKGVVEYRLAGQVGRGQGHVWKACAMR